VMLAKVDLANLLYVVAALAVASLVSAVYVLVHRKPRSMEAGIESFSRELRALAPDRRGRADRSTVAPGRPGERDSEHQRG
jgi:hypothetical protein